MLSALPFILTADQDRVVDEILTDMGRSAPMMRLLQGDVGSGKTVVAALALVTAAANGSRRVDGADGGACGTAFPNAHGRFQSWNREANRGGRIADSVESCRTDRSASLG